MRRAFLRTWNGLQRRNNLFFFLVWPRGERQAGLSHGNVCVGGGGGGGGGDGWQRFWFSSNVERDEHCSHLEQLIDSHCIICIDTSEHIDRFLICMICMICMIWPTLQGGRPCKTCMSALGHVFWHTLFTIQIGQNRSKRQGKDLQ